ncbi:uncharacterized protein K02A2.6-like [Anneissia japonica]|uniref:uncharacterized protein K02A2.6-like n=1 Tax=Anneissia japonica TaxID=1529436 RepID=UPI0014258838|nr:uncharacterized protein K02A2.6-like [Anneissia japonica]
MRKDIKNKVHTGHMGINACLRRARDLVFWPGMSKEIRQFVETCDICAQHGYNKQPKEPLISYPLATRPWERVAVDLFVINERNYLVTVGYFSTFFKFDYLTDTSSSTVITKLKHHFVRHGIPDQVVSDGGPQFSSNNFKAFSTAWGFQHILSSPGNSQSNGAAEAAVKVAKRLMKKCASAGEDPYMGLLNIRNTQTESMTTTPTERLMGRKPKTILPTKQNSHTNVRNQRRH